MTTKTIITIDEFQSMALSHCDDDIKVDDVYDSIEVKQHNESPKGSLYIMQKIREIIRQTIWKYTIPDWAK